MYNATFESDSGIQFDFGMPNNIFDMDLGSGVSVTYGTSQGFSQVGETIETSSVGSRQITVKGILLKDIYNQKKLMRRVFSPFAAGKLVMEDGKYIYVNVQDPPSFSPVRNDGKYTMKLVAAFPYFRDATVGTTQIGGIIPRFRFPVNYGEPHMFGEKIHSYYVTINNQSEVNVPMDVHIKVNGTSTNPTITNMLTLDYLKLEGTFAQGSVIDVYRDRNNILRAELTTSDGVTSDIIYRIDEDSTLFELSVGDNIIGANDDEGGMGMSVTIKYDVVEVAWYEPDSV